jgi:hypothetical protein
MANAIDNGKPLAALPVILVAAGRVARTALARGMIGLAAVIGLGFASVDRLPDARPGPVPAFSERFVFEIPAPAGEAVDLTAARRDAAAAVARLQAGEGRRRDGAPARGSARYVTIGERTGEATSELVRYRLLDVAGE